MNRFKCPACGAINSVVPEEEDQDGRI